LRTWNQTFFFYFRAGKFWSAAPNIEWCGKMQKNGSTASGRGHGFFPPEFRPEFRIPSDSGTN
jgi:hypothetical protein